jgi:phosphoadenosine phosphosulfate reductase
MSITESELAGADPFAALNEEFEDRHALDIIQWAVDEYSPDIAVTSSFGADSAVMLHLAATVSPDIRVISLNTGFLFEETLAFRAELEKRLNLNIQEYKPALSAEEFVETHSEMWKSDPNSCCAFNKQEPMARAKKGLAAWITGVRREQSFTRRQTPYVSADADGLIKICPIADWSAREVHRYLLEHELPYHPLREKGYLSIGCTHCTKQVKPGEDPRSGRWAGFDKTECGLHTYDKGSGI